MVEALIGLKVAINPLDRWRNSPLDDAMRGNHTDAIAALQAAGGQSTAAGPAVVAVAAPASVTPLSAS